MKPISNIVYWIQYLTLSFILDLQETSILNSSKPTTCRPAKRHVVGFLDFFIDVFLEVQHKRYSSIVCLIDYIAYGVHL